jgi:hypothetical protein
LGWGGVCGVEDLRMIWDALIRSYVEHLPKIPQSAMTQVEGKNVPTNWVVREEIERLRDLQKVEGA